MKVKLLKLIIIASCAIIPPIFGQARTSGATGSNNQVVIVQGSITNTAMSNSTAKVNIGSVVGSGKQVPSGNNQQVLINGSVINSASGSSKSEINIGSVVAQD